MFAYTVYINSNIIGAYLLLTLIISCMNYQIGMHFHSQYLVTGWCIMFISGMVLRCAGILKRGLGFYQGSRFVTIVVCMYMYVHVCICCTLVFIVPDSVFCSQSTTKGWTLVLPTLEVLSSQIK